ncbi:SGNH/GDSL hydrolase family protein [Coraliomargarita algicola]|uniref:SGNH/GDSL hydrolase family protein n=1 Tax=Coraliomargarita algicola TaxID=3092156 RepID=A0ABZ0RIV2_9BACT|nr:SGNH/GDSL hydrolase family protein [Coraliomargarita sp. J2-16]WPJ96135.1 SGNH/GDSL hydrolase family protein [Coraliomargarita sp. J2-16]
MKPFSCLKALLSLVIASLCSTTILQADAESHDDAVEFIPRDGLPNFFQKLASNQEVTVAYLGGSITAQTGWRVLSQKWFEEQYPQASVTGVHAAIGGTGSDLGVYRVENDALAAKPDLLFVEFAVNDGRASEENITKSMEGIVRKTWKANPETDICFVYTMTASNSKALAKGKRMRSASVMESVAYHYGIPSIELGYQAALMEMENKLVMKTSAPMTRVSGDEIDESAAMATDAEGRIIFSKDGVHPYPETGHVLYTEALIRSLKQIQKNTARAPHLLKSPIREDNLENAQQILLTPQYLSGPYTDLRAAGNTRFQKELKQLYRLEPGATLSFKFKGTEVALYDLLGYDSAKVEVTLDGETTTSTRMDGYCTYQRLARLKVGSALEDTIHEVTIRVLDEQLNKRNILFERNRGDYDKNPEKYAKLHWNVGAIFIVGEILD